MFPTSGAKLPSLLIVENKNGSVFFVETNETESQVDRILRNKDPVRRDVAIKNIVDASAAASSSKIEKLKPVLSSERNGGSNSKLVLDDIDDFEKLPEKPKRKKAKPFYVHTPMILKQVTSHRHLHIKLICNFFLGKI